MHVEGLGQDGYSPPVWMPPYETRLPRQKLIEAIEFNMADYWLSLGRIDGGFVMDEPDLKWSYTGSRFLNRVVDARLNADTARERIHDVLAEFDERRAAVTWLIGPSNQPGELGNLLTEAGFHYYGDWLGMALSEPLRTQLPGAPVHLEITEVRTPEQLEAWSGVVARGFQLPDEARATLHNICDPGSDQGRRCWRHYLGYVDGEPVSSSSLYLTARSAGIYLVSTLPEARRSGFGAALTRQAVLEAQNRGFQTIVLQATQEGHGTYRRLGFQDYCRIRVYRWEPSGVRWHPRRVLSSVSQVLNKSR